MPVIGEGGALSSQPRQRRPGPVMIRRPEGTAAPSRGWSVLFFGDVTRRGPWTVAEQSTTLSIFGDCTFDMREASFSAAEVRVRTWQLFGDVKVIVPPGTDVHLGGSSIFGDLEDRRRTTPSPDSPRVTVRAHSVFGDVDVIEMEIGEQEPKWYERFWPRRK
ncbi:Cell wall-active antibiotics response 4TMS YvqF [Austwickia chelonae]|nr:Cell wall-active antibiotics response 4TMS YvqF [Austwickia chelonae]